MLAVGRGAAAHVDGDIQNSTVQDRDQFGLGVSWELEMQTPQRTCRSRIRLVVLHEPVGNAEVMQALLVEGFAEPSPGVNVALWGNNPRQVRREKCGGTHDAKIAILLLNKDPSISKSSPSLWNNIRWDDCV